MYINWWKLFMLMDIVIEILYLRFLSEKIVFNIYWMDLSHIHVFLVHLSAFQFTPTAVKISIFYLTIGHALCEIWILASKV